MTWCHCIRNVPICCGNQTPSWLPSSPKGEIVGNMMQSVVLDGNPLNEDEDMRLLTCVVLDGNPPDEFILQHVLNLDEKSMSLGIHGFA